MREAGSGAAKSADSAERADSARSGKGTKSAAGRHSARKAPRRTAERILEVTLELFNRFGEPNVSTTTIAVAIGAAVSPVSRAAPARARPSSSAAIARDLRSSTFWKCVSRWRLRLKRSLRSRYRKRYCQISSNSRCMKSQASSTLPMPSAVSRISASARS